MFAADWWQAGVPKEASRQEKSTRKRGNGPLYVITYELMGTVLLDFQNLCHTHLGPFLSIYLVTPLISSNFKLKSARARFLFHMALKVLFDNVNLVVIFIPLLVVGGFLLQLIKTYQSGIPGPFLARFTRFWLFNEVRKGTFHTTNVKLHQIYGISRFSNTERLSC